MRVLLYIITASIIISGCSSSKNAGSVSSRSLNSSKLDEPTMLKMRGMFIDAQGQKNIGNFDQAMSLLDRVLEIDPNHHAALFDQAMILDRQGEYDSAIKKVEKASTLDPTNTWYKVLKAQLYTITNKLNIAEKTYLEIIKSDANNFEYNYDLASIRMRMGNFEDAISALNAIEERTGFNEEIILEKHSLFLEINKPELARQEIQKLIDNDPSESSYYHMMAGVYEFEKNDAKVMEYLSKVEELDPNNGVVKLYLFDHYKNKGDDEKANNVIREAFENETIDIDTKMDVLLRYYEMVQSNPSEIENAYQLIDILKRVHPNEAKSHAISGDFLMRDGKFQGARDAFKKATELDPSKVAIWNQLISLDAQLNDSKLLVSDTKLALDYFPTTPLFYYYNGIGNNMEGDYLSAVESLMAGKELIFNDEPLEVEFYSALGNSYHELNKYADSDKYFEKALVINPQNTFVLNNYSYYLSLRKENLATAESMSRLANELEPNSPTFQDTYGWVLYCNNKFDEAKIWLKKAMDNGGDSQGIILEHYGDTLFQLGEESMALDYWLKAKEKGDFSENLLEKIEKNKLIE